MESVIRREGQEHKYRLIGERVHGRKTSRQRQKELASQSISTTERVSRVMEK